MIKIFAIAALLLSSVFLKAQLQMRDLLPTAPNAIMPLLTENNRLDMIDFADNNMLAEVRNTLGSFCSLDTLASDYLHITMTTKTELEMTLLNCANNNDVIAVVHTSKIPYTVSSISFYDTNWVTKNIKLTIPSAADFVSPLTHDDPSYDLVAQAVRELDDLPLIAITLQPQSQTLTMTISDAPLTPESQQAIINRIHNIIYKWNEETCTFDNLTTAQ